MTPHFVFAAKTTDLSDPGRQTLELQDRLLVLVHAAGVFYCFDDVCTHDGGPLGEGKINGTEIACPRHGAQFDMRTGKALTMPATQPTLVHEVKVEGDDVLVRIRES